MPSSSEAAGQMNKPSYTPAFEIFGGDGVMAAAVKARLSTLRLRDEAGIQSDELEIVLDDRAPAIIPPDVGETFRLKLGYEETVLHDMRAFIFDETVFSGPPKTLTLRARAADMLTSLKAQKERSWDNITIGALVSQIAGEHGLGAAVATQYSGTTIFHFDQNESDMHFLTRLGHGRGAIASVKDGTLVFAPRGKGTELSGSSLEIITLKPADLTSWRAIAANRTLQGSVKVRWYNHGLAEPVYEVVGDGDPVTLLGEVFADQQTALAAANAALKRGIQKSGSLSLEMPGDARIRAETPLELGGFRDGVDGRWIVNSVEHDLSSSGFISRVEAEGVAP